MLSDEVTKQYCLYCCLEKNRADGCELCGADAAGQEVETHPLYLKPGTILEGKYLIGRVLGRGGFGVTYMGVDLQLQLRVAIKEHLPHELASRGAGDNNLEPFSDKDREDYQYGLDKFIEEARTLARFSEHPHIVSVLNFFQANNTAYLIMPYLEGMSLDMHLANRGGRLQEPEAVQIIMMILDGLKSVHQADILHRDVKPQNIFITTDGFIKLIDFGSARTAMWRHSQVLSKIVSDGYSPFEQYITTGQEGPWTDIYAAGSACYHMLSGQKPPMATERAQQDNVISLKELLGDSVSRSVSDVVAKCMAVEAGERYQSVDEVLFDLTQERIGRTSTSILHFHLPESELSVRAMQPETMLSERFRIIEIIQIDSVGIVYKASDAKHQDEIVALRLLPVEVTDVETSRQLAKAIEPLKSLSHRNIQKVRDIHLDGEDLYIVSEFVEGQNLLKYLNDHGPLSVKAAVSTGVKIGEALSQAHAQGVFHGTLDSESIIIDDSDQVKVTGLGYAWLLREIVQKASGNKMSLHTLFMAPEQWLESKVDELTDCYAMGMTLYESLAGHHPWRDVGDLDQRVQYQLPPPIKDTPRPVMQAIITAVQKDQNIRYRSAKDFRIRLVKAMQRSDTDFKANDQDLDDRPKTIQQPKTEVSQITVRSIYEWFKRIFNSFIVAFKLISTIIKVIILAVLLIILAMALNSHSNRNQIGENVKVIKKFFKKELSDEDIKEQYKESCNKGDGKDCYNLASILFNQEKKWSEAKPYYEKACENGVKEACGDLGTGLLLKDDNWREAKPKFKLACDAGIQSACFQYASILIMKENSPNEARRIFMEVCEAGNQDACTQYGILLWKNGSWARARPILIKACEADQKIACRFAGAGLQYEDNNWSSARIYSKKGCDLGSNDSCLVYAQGIYGYEHNWQSAKPIFKRLCEEENDLMACFNLGEGVRKEERNDNLANSLIKKACDGGMQLACYSLSSYY